MATVVVPPNRLWKAIEDSVEDVQQDFAAELAEVVIDNCRIDTGRLLRSINLNNGQNPAKQDTWRNKKPEANHKGLQETKKRTTRQQSKKRVKSGAPWWIVAGAPYASYVYSINSRRHFMFLSQTDINRAKRLALRNFS